MSLRTLESREPYTFCFWRCLLRRRNRIGEYQLGQAILVGGIGVGDVCFGLAQFRLGKLHYGAESQVIPLLRQVEREVGLLSQLLGDRETLIGLIGLSPGCRDAAPKFVAQAPQPLTGD